MRTNLIVCQLFTASFRFGIFENNTGNNSKDFSSVGEVRGPVVTSLRYIGAIKIQMRGMFLNHLQMQQHLKVFIGNSACMCKEVCFLKNVETYKACPCLQH